LQHGRITARLLGEVTVASLIVAVPLSVHAGLLSKFFAPAPAVAAPVAELRTTAVDVPLLTAQQNPNPLSGKGGAEILVDEDALVSTGPVGEDVIAEQKSSLGEIRVYTVREGDSLSQVAEMFGVTTNTIMWANDLNRATEIQPGDTLVILPIVGVQHEIKSGDTISSIAKKYEGDEDEILAYNQLTSAEELSVGNTIIIPGGAMHAAPVRVAQATPVSVSGSVSGGGFSHPAPGSVKTQGIHGYNAVDLAGGYGTPIRAAAAGEVIVSKSSGWNGGYGQYVVIRHANGAQTLYAHLMRNDVGVGAYVSQGQVIGGMGSTGRSTGTHLHFEVRGARNPF
jgi:LysM repeat protein